MTTKPLSLRLDDVHIGKKYKSYSALCRELGLVPAQGNSKAAQVKELNRFLSWEKGEGYSLVITDVHPKPKPKAMRADDKHSSDVLTCLLWGAQGLENADPMPQTQEVVTKTFTFEQIVKLCGFVNGRYSTTNRTAVQQINEFCSAYGCLSARQCVYYFNELDMHIKTYCGNVLNRCLNRLKKKGYLDSWSFGFWVKRDGDLKRASAAEEDMLNRINEEVKRELGISYLNVYNRSQFYRVLSSRAIEELECEGVYKLREISVDLSCASVSEQEYTSARDRINATSLEVFRGQIAGDIEKGIEREAERIWEETLAGSDGSTLEAIELFGITPMELHRMLAHDQDERYLTIDGIKRGLIEWFVSLDRS